jgi:16S rRNA (uracil1498-N3)-methyltransferase
MQVFFSTEINSDTCVLDRNESRHCIKVLRMSGGSPVSIIDGSGSLYEGFITDPDPFKCVITISRTHKDFEKRGYRLHIGISPIKNQDRFEWFVEKGVEIGIDEITPVICRNTEKPGIKYERLNNIVISAMKQSLKALKPVLNPPRKFVEFANSDFAGIKMIAHCNSSIPCSRIVDVYKRGMDAVMLIGPEGDFSEDEIRLATGKGFIPVHLGRSRLRTETAGIAACHSIYFMNQ